MTIKEFMYRHYVIGMFKGLDGRSYEILAPAPDYHFELTSCQCDRIWEYRIVNPEHIQEPCLGIYDKRLQWTLDTFKELREFYKSRWKDSCFEKWNR